MRERVVESSGHWDDEVDVVVAGSGAAGLTGAVVSALAGAHVVVLEKSDLVGGTTAKSGGGAWIADNHHMPEVGVTDSREEALTYLRALTGGRADDSMLQTLVDRGKEMARHLEDNGVVHFRAYPSVGGTLDYYPDVPGSRHGGRPLDSGRFPAAELGEWADRIQLGVSSFSAVDKFDTYAQRGFTKPKRPTFVDVGHVVFEDGGARTHFANGTSLVAQLLRGCLRTGVRVMTGTPVVGLIRDAGRIAGVVASRDGAPVRIRARRGVLIATGGFEWNPELCDRFLDRPLETSCGVRTNTGDGHLLGEAAGAALANMTDAWWQVVAKVRDARTGLVESVHVRAERCLPHSIIVDTSGRRFFNESVNYYEAHRGFGAKADPDRHLPAWLICDQQYLDKHGLLTGAPPSPTDPPEWLVTADTLAELAARIGVDAGGLADEVRRFNGFAEKGEDLDFGRGSSTWDKIWGDPDHLPNPALGSVAVSPFHAIEMHAGVMGTKGGLRIDVGGRVLDQAGEPIPGLFAAGNAAAGSVPGAYPGPGSTIGPAMTFGYLVGRQLGTDGAAVPAGAGRRERSER
ncbi:MAG TPA: FAD-dependent oxidoreductase [Amycolatopsis sp.]|nr:FAD-dependent oxidoreductase [Amycolatopsis sp.]